MSHELYFTSAPKGLRPGSNGYCTVTATYGLPGPLFQKLEAISDYRPLFDEAESANGRNPIALAHLRIPVQGKTWNVVSRICMAGTDHSRRRVFFAHHVALEGTELPPGGPVWLVGQNGFLEKSWNGQVKELSVGRRPVMGDSTPSVCQAWAAATGDAGWAGHLAEEYQKNPNKPAYILYPLKLNPLPLLMEALALLPPELRWQVTFSTLYRSLPQDVSCLWRCLPLEAPEANKVRSLPGTLVFDLGRPFGPADGGPLVEAARTGKPPRRASTPASRPTEQQPAAAGAWWKPEPRASAPVEREVEPEPEPVLESAVEPDYSFEPPPVRIDAGERHRDYPESNSLSWFLPFALGVVMGVLIISACAAVGWRLLTEGHTKELAAKLEQAQKKATEERESAVSEAESRADEARKKELKRVADLNKAKVAKVLREKDTAASELDSVQQERENVKKKLLETTHVVEKEQKEKRDLNEAIAARNNALEALATAFFSMDSNESKAVKQQLEAFRKNKGGKDANWPKMLDDWLDTEVQNLTDERTKKDLGDLNNELDYCKFNVNKGGKGVEDRCKKAIVRCDNLMKDTKSLLVRKVLERIKERFKRLLAP